MRKLRAALRSTSRAHFAGLPSQCGCEPADDRALQTRCRDPSWLHFVLEIGTHYGTGNRRRVRRFPGAASRHRGSSLMPEPSECIDRADRPCWLHFVLEIGKDLAPGRPLAQDILNCVELRLRVSTLAEPIAAERSGRNIRRL